MPKVALKAHFDGERIVLDDPFDLPANVPLVVTLVSQEAEGSWLKSAAASEAFAFLADPAEDIYSLADGQPVNNAL